MKKKKKKNPYISILKKYRSKYPVLLLPWEVWWLFLSCSLVIVYVM